MIRKLVLALLIGLGFVLQSTAFQSIALAGVVPNIMLIITSCFGFMRGKDEGMMVGFFCGLLIDIFYGGSILGIYALIYLGIGYMNGMFAHIFYPEDVKLPIFFIAISDFTYCIVTYVFLFMLRTKIDFIHYLTKIILPEVVYTVVVTLIVYRIILFINLRLEDLEKRNEAKFA